MNLINLKRVYSSECNASFFFCKVYWISFSFLIYLCKVSSLNILNLQIIWHNITIFVILSTVHWISKTMDREAIVSANVRLGYEDTTLAINYKIYIEISSITCLQIYLPNSLGRIPNFFSFCFFHHPFSYFKSNRNENLVLDHSNNC